MTKLAPQARFDRLKRTSSKSWMQGHVQSLRLELCEDLEPTTKKRAICQKIELRNHLAGQGYTVNGSPVVWSVYVVQLDETARDDVGKGWVYVGQTSLTPEDRLKVQLSGKRNSCGPVYSKTVFKHGQYLRRDLVRDLPVLYSADESKIVEKELADELEAKGYRVAGGH